MKELDDMETDENKEYVNIVTWEWALSHGNGPCHMGMGLETWEWALKHRNGP